jgi:hypothetical protein
MFQHLLAMFRHIKYYLIIFKYYIDNGSVVVEVAS